jgi:ATP-binding protein involved in chromosome partitioning
MAEVTSEIVLEALKDIVDPGRGSDVVSLGMVSGLIVKGGNVGFALDISRDDGGAVDGQAAEPLRKSCEDAVKALPGVMSASVVLTAERASAAAEQPAGPPPGMPGEDEPMPGPQAIPGIKTIVAVASGKGGVGKSTVAVNLALALKGMGLKVGLLDADVYGPSIPKLLGTQEKPESDGEKVSPVYSHGMPLMSMGFLVDQNQPMIWRGPMVAGAVTQMFQDIAWGELDVLVVDMPPGTGDAQLTLAQKVPVTGAVIVSTPQDIALIDARKGLEMFRKVDVPVFGIVENMATFICPNCGEASDIFGHGGARKIASELSTDFLGEIPLHMSIRETSDAGNPVVESAPDSVGAKAFIAIAEQVAARLKDKLAN